MSTLKDLIKEAPVHERKLEMKSYPVKDDKLVVEGWLRDERFIPGYQWDGQERDPEVIHHMVVRLLVGGFPLTIEDAEAEMPGVPRDMCHITRESVKKIIGVKIVSGFSEEVRRRIGGIEGCAHLTHLIVVMGPAALHGYWTHASRKPRPVPQSLEEFTGLEFLVNTCQLWKEDGPLIQMIKDTLENRA